MSRHLISGLLLLLYSTTAWSDRPDLSIEISGVSGEMLTNVQSNLGLYLQRDHPLLSGSLIRRMHGNATGEIRKALQPFGYYRPVIDASLDQQEDGRWVARYDIDPADAIRVDEINILISGDAMDDPAFQRWHANYPLNVGDFLLHQRYETAKSRLLQLGRERGYIDGRLLRQRITVDLENYSAMIDLHYESGPRYSFGEVTIEQEDFDENFLRRYLNFETGDPFDSSQLLSLRRMLADSDYFARTDVLPLYDQAMDRQIPIQVTLTPRKRKLYTAGLGYSTDTGARGRLGFEERRANQYGHRYDAMLRQSEIQSSFIARYNVPLRHPMTDTLTYSIRLLDEETDTTDSTLAAIGFDVTQQMGSWLRTTGLSYQWERYIIEEEETSVLLIPQVRFQRIKADQRIATWRGWIFVVGVRGASEAVMSSTSFMQLRTNGKYIHSITERHRVLLRAAGGWSWVPEFVELPTSQRFFAGGDQSVRGYPYNSLGPENEEGRVVGGRHLFVGSAEYEFDIVPARASIPRLAVFHDAGNAYNGWDYDPQLGAGVGLRWRTPIGAVRIDFAQALSKDGRPWRLHLTLGPDL